MDIINCSSNKVQNVRFLAWILFLTKVRLQNHQAASTCFYVSSLNVRLISQIFTKFGNNFISHSSIFRTGGGGGGGRSSSSSSSSKLETIEL